MTVKTYTYRAPKYLTPEDPDAFVDFPKMPQPVKYYPERTAECPKCKGHGGWNLQINAYGLPPNTEDTAENRHKYSHFRAACNQCWSWGWVTPAEATGCIHEYETGRNLGNCLNEWVCKKCGKTLEVDSSG